MNRTATWERTSGKTWRVSFNRGPVLSPLGEWKRDGGMDAYLGRFHGSGGLASTSFDEWIRDRGASVTYLKRSYYSGTLGLIP